MSEVVDNYLLPILASICFLVVAILVTFATKRGKIFTDVFNRGADEKRMENKEVQNHAMNKEEIQSDKHVENKMMEDAEKAKKEVQVMAVEREIVGFALTRLYEAEAEGKISEKDRIQLIDKYKDEMQRLEKAIEQKQMIIRLHNLEETRTNLIELFHSKLDEISKNIDDIKITLGIHSPRTVQPSRSDKTPPEKRKKTPKKAAAPTRRTKSDAEERIEAVQEEVLKILERLEQIETEG